MLGKIEIVLFYALINESDRITGLIERNAMAGSILKSSGRETHLEHDRREWEDRKFSKLGWHRGSRSFRPCKYSRDGSFF